MIFYISAIANNTLLHPSILFDHLWFFSQAWFLLLKVVLYQNLLIQYIEEKRLKTTVVVFWLYINKVEFTWTWKICYHFNNRTYLESFNHSKKLYGTHDLWFCTFLDHQLYLITFVTLTMLRPWWKRKTHKHISVWFNLLIRGLSQ